MEVKNVPLENLFEYARNPRKNDDVVDKMVSCIKEFGFRIPIIAKSDGTVVDGHLRLKAARKMGLEEVPVINADDLTEVQIKAFRLVANRSANWAEWDEELLKLEFKELDDLDFDLQLTGFDLDEIENYLNENEEPKEPECSEIIEDEIPSETDGEPITRPGDLWLLGEHRLLCGDATIATDVDTLVDGTKVDLVFTDPPYGMGKEDEGVLNDNQNEEELLQFSLRWVPLSFAILKENGSWYCWGIDEPLMDIYSNILKPMKKENKITFRNLITWDKGSGQGQLEKNRRKYASADEKCLFVMVGICGFNTNSENYYEGWEPIREYLLKSRLDMGWDVPAMKRIVGHSDLSRDHWTSKSQFELLTEKNYNKLKEAAENERRERGVSNEAFKKDYKELKAEYEGLTVEFEERPQAFYGGKSYFDNLHDNMNSVWHFVGRRMRRGRKQVGMLHRNRLRYAFELLKQVLGKMKLWQIYSAGAVQH